MTGREDHELAIERLERELGGRVGVAARDLASGAEVLYRPDELFPLASVFKVPLMVALLRAVDAGTVTLDERLELTERVKSPGSTLVHCDPGLAPTLRDLLYLTITLSDNTATDMLWRRLGRQAINDAMRELGLDEHRLQHAEPGVLPPRDRAQRRLGGDERGRHRDAVARARRRRAVGPPWSASRSSTPVSPAPTSCVAGWTRYGWSDETDYDDAFVFDQALDNQGTPRDIAELLAMVAEGRCASGPSCELMVEVLSRQEWTTRIPAGLPPGLQGRQQDRQRGRHGQRRGHRLPARRAAVRARRVLQGAELPAQIGRRADDRAHRRRRVRLVRRLAGNDAVMNVNGMRCLLAGGARGLGAALALDLAGHGADVAVSYHSSAGRAEETCAGVRALGRRCAAVQVDLTDADDARAARRARRRRARRPRRARLRRQRPLRPAPPR